MIDWRKLIGIIKHSCCLEHCEKMIEIVPNRQELLKLIPKRGICAEVGVYKGDFSQYILSVCEPKLLCLIDGWETIDHTPSDTNGEKIDYTDKNFWIETRNFVNRKFESNKNVKILCGDSIVTLNTFPDEYFDFIYIDANHTYQSFKNDLFVALTKIKKNGFIGGHDFCHTFINIPSVLLEFVYEKKLKPVEQFSSYLFKK